jgi:hypothetical protein
MIKQVTPQSVTETDRSVIIVNAVAILNNHAGVFGWGPDAKGETWEDRQPDAMASLPDVVRVPLIRAMAGAARFLAITFEQAL